MTIRIEKHARGLVITAPGGVDRDRRVSALGSSLSDFAIVSGRRLIAPLNVAADVLRALPREEAAWDDDIFQYAQRQLTDRNLQVRARLEVARAIDDPLSVLAGYPKLSQLDPHQLQAAAAISAPSLRGIALFDEQGTGKTISTLAAFDFMKSSGRLNKMLVVAPKSVLASWQEQCDRFFIGQLRVAMAGGNASERRKAIVNQHDVLLIGYEGAVRDESTLRLVLGAKPGSYLLVADESYVVKNPATARAGAVVRLRSLCERAVVLCGTPAPNSAVDVVNQIDIADGGATFAGRRVSKDRAAAHDEVAEALRDAIYLRRLKEDVLPNIPPKQVERVYIDLAPTQRELYEKMRLELLSDVNRVNDREFSQQLASFLTKRTRLLQICSNPLALDPLYDEVPAKLRALDRLLREIVEGQRKKVVVWSYFRASLEAIAQRFSKYGLVRIDGTVNSIEDRISSMERFQSDPGTQIFLGNAAAAGAGITLTAAHHAIYESFSNQAAHYMQSVDRIHRRGQKEHVVSHVLIAKDTLEEAEYSRLVDKERAGRDLLGDQFEEPVTKHRFLAELAG